MYDPYHGFQNPYANQFNQYNNPNPQVNMLPAQRVIQVSGKASVDTIRMAPNSSVLLMDTTAPLVWLCVSDGVGRVTATPYDITEHKDEEPARNSDLESRVSNVELMLSKLEGKINAIKPDDAGAKPKRNQSETVAD